MPTWMTTAEAMKHLKVGRTKFYELIKAGRVKQYRFPDLGEPRYDKDEIDASFTVEEPDSRKTPPLA